MINATHKMINDGRRAMFLENVQVGTTEYSSVALEYTDIEKLGSGKPNGFHIQNIRKSKLEKL